MSNCTLEIEKLKGKNIEELYLEYRFLVKPTILKYYSRYINSMWEDDIYSCAEIGVYNGILKINIDKIKDEHSIKSAIVWSIRKHIKDFERKIFGSEHSEKRNGYYKTDSYNKEVGNKSDNNRSYEDMLEQSNVLCSNKNEMYLDEDTRIDNLDLYYAIKRLNSDERYIIERLLNNVTLETIGNEMGIGKDKAFRLKKKVLAKLKRELEVI